MARPARQTAASISPSPQPQSYVHHCHIVEHEDNDMMRPFTVTP